MDDIQDVIAHQKLILDGLWDMRTRLRIIEEMIRGDEADNARARDHGPVG